MASAGRKGASAALRCVCSKGRAEPFKRFPAQAAQPCVAVKESMFATGSCERCVESSAPSCSAGCPWTIMEDAALLAAPDIELYMRVSARVSVLTLVRVRSQLPCHLD